MKPLLLLARAAAGLSACIVTGASSIAVAGDLAREVLPTSDGWASVATAALPNGTIGGSLATPDRVRTVRTRDELVAALAWPDATPKIVLIDGSIDANVDAAGAPLECTDYYRPDPVSGEMYSLEKFLAAFDPAGPWGRKPPAGPQEQARIASVAAQQARVRIRIPANTTIVGLDRDAELRGAWFDIRPVSTVNNTPMNVIIRNLTFQDAADCFPAWSPTDGATGNWNALYDSISVRNASHIWINQNTFRDYFTRDVTLPVYFGRLFQVHDGHVDVTNSSDHVTISWNRFLDHDKVMLIGSSDGAIADRDRLRVTIHHNLFHGVGQRVPRVRFGQVHVYNNFYNIHHLATYGYSWGVGIESQLYAENNYFLSGKSIVPADYIDRFNGTRITNIGTRRGGTKAGGIIDVVAAWNAVNDPDLLPDAGWTPVLYGPAGMADPSNGVPQSVDQGAGPQNW